MSYTVALASGSSGVYGVFVGGTLVAGSSGGAENGLGLLTGAHQASGSVIVSVSANAQFTVRSRGNLSDSLSSAVDGVNPTKRDAHPRQAGLAREGSAPADRPRPARQLDLMRMP